LQSNSTLSYRSPNALKVDEEFSSLMPTPSEEEYKALLADVKARGVQEPIVVAVATQGVEDYTVIDGHTRLRAALEAGVELVPVRLVSWESRDEALLYAKRINLHRRHLDDRQKCLAIADLFSKHVRDYLKGKGSKDVWADAAKMLGVSKGYLSIAVRYANAVAEYPDLRKVSSIKKAVAEADRRRRVEVVSSLIPDDETDEELMAKFGYKPRPYDVWSFSGIDEAFGVRHPGNIPAGIVFNTLYFWTEQGDLVVDPMAGGGVVLDVCKVMKRKCLAYDIAPVRDDIKQHDIRGGFPAEAHGCDLIFVDPPYWKKKASDYVEDSISSLSRDQYLAFFEKFAYDCHEALVEGGVVAFLMSDYIGGRPWEGMVDPSESIFVDEYIRLFKQAGFDLLHLIQVPLSTEQYDAWDVDRAKRSRGILVISRWLAVFRRPYE